MIRLKKILQDLSVSQADFGRAMDLSPTTVAEWLNHGREPKRVSFEQVRRWLVARGVKGEQLRQWRLEVEPQALDESNTQPAGLAGKNPEEMVMLLRAIRLSSDELRHFQLFRDPFHNELRSHEDMWFSPELRHVRETIWQRFLRPNGEMMALVGESGSGKSMLRRDLIDRIKRDNEQIRVIQPHVWGMSERDKEGKTMKAIDIAHTIVSTLAPKERLKRDSQARMAQVQQVLTESLGAGFKHLLIIEEAHSLPTPTIKHLKRIVELESEWSRLIGVLLIGQPELGLRLRESDPSVREVVQRCEVVHLRALDNELPNYLQHKFARQGAQLDAVLTPDAVSEVQNCLTMVPRGRRNATPISLVYPLAVGNLVAGAMRKAVKVGAPQVTGDLVQEVLREV